MDGISKETHDSVISASSMFPGFRFSPTDQELISYYLKKKIDGSDNCVEVISETDICRCEPWDLPAKSVIPSDDEWFFFSPRGKRYPNGSQSKRATEFGYWKATGKERHVRSGTNLIGTKRTLVFHIGRAPKGERTEWIMHEYCMRGDSQDLLVVCRLRRNNDFCQSENLSGSFLDQGRRLVAVNDINCDATEVHINQEDTFEGDKIADCSSRWCSSSSLDSPSIKQINCTLEGEQGLMDEVFQDLYEEDFYEDILKDDIIQLDDCWLVTTPRVSAGNQFESEGQKREPLQGTTHRRIRLTRRRGKSCVEESMQSRCGSTHRKKVGISLDPSPELLMTALSAVLIVVAVILLPLSIK